MRIYPDNFTDEQVLILRERAIALCQEGSPLWCSDNLVARDRYYAKERAFEEVIRSLSIVQTDDLFAITEVANQLSREAHLRGLL